MDPITGRARITSPKEENSRGELAFFSALLGDEEEVSVLKP